MADFVTKASRNNRFSVNRSEKIFIKCSVVEKETWLTLVDTLQKRRNTGTQVETFLYLLRKKYVPGKNRVLKRNGWASVERFSGILFKVSEEEMKLWKARVAAHGGSQVEAFNEMVDKEYFFQDQIEVITQ